MNETDHEFELRMVKTGPIEFKTIFDQEHFPELMFDEPERSGGENKYPNAARIVTAAIANCLSASLSFCLTKSKVEIEELKTRAKCTMGRNEEGRLRIKKVEIEIETKLDQEKEKKIKRCIEMFEKFCVVSQSLTEGIEIEAKVKEK
ncbi:MAG: OsmC family protein [Candidatus Heimdallarchaeota archaeon]|nr:OsmC family protein [Candidatus Heimdallarchaeota archaeon]MCK5048744.1 OsmC family protein [Candidatus Heimdallarchaeota archaeon]